ncbi:MAG: hypothetical protein EXX96DRAFT_542914 [Benjaminiella poitrasii]|nr:MAG: hypothetical protein EXX96DRAFT_542914 [Benjaminiella poitrasii]
MESAQRIEKRTHEVLENISENVFSSIAESSKRLRSRANNVDENNDIDLKNISRSSNGSNTSTRQTDSHIINEVTKIYIKIIRVLSDIKHLSSHFLKHIHNKRNKILRLLTSVRILRLLVFKLEMSLVLFIQILNILSFLTILEN